MVEGGLIVGEDGEVGALVGAGGVGERGGVGEGRGDVVEVEYDKFSAPIR